MKTLIKPLTLLFVFAALSSFQSKEDKKFNSKLLNYCNSIEKKIESIPPDRKSKIEQIAINLMREDQKRLLFVCTHNSRRSHFAQVWFNTAMDYYGVEEISSQSGGAASTAVNERVIEALKTTGLKVKKETNGDNPKYEVDNGISSISIYSKSINEKELEKTPVLAIQVCSYADQSCPKVPYAVHQFELPFDDPRFYDGTPSEEVKYSQKQNMIATEMFYLASLLKREEVFAGEMKKIEE